VIYSQIITNSVLISWEKELSKQDMQHYFYDFWLRWPFRLSFCQTIIFDV